MVFIKLPVCTMESRFSIGFHFSHILQYTHHSTVSDIEASVTLADTRIVLNQND